MMMTRTATIDPIERIVRDGLNAAGIQYVDERAPEAERLDFYLPDFGVHIEVKQFHSDRIAEQMSRVPNVIAIQGRSAAELFARMITK